MKAKHLLAALALPIVFSACNQDELVMNDVEKEVIGTPIGYDLEFTSSFGGPSTRITNDGKWEQDEKIGLGWISDITNTNLAASAKGLYSNHPIYCENPAGSSFKSRTMIYEGLYIASYPYQMTTKITPLKFDLSIQNSFAEASKRYSARWNVSDKFIDLRGDQAGIGNATALNLVSLTNLMKLNIKLAADASVPDDFKVIGVTLVDATGKLVKSLTLDVTQATVAADKNTVVAANWTADIAAGNIEVSVGEKNVGSVIGANGLDVFVQMGAFASDDATTLTIQTNYGNATIKTGSESVAWKGVEYSTTEAKVATFAEAVKAMNTAATTANKELGANVFVNVTLDSDNIEIPTTVTNQTDLDKIIVLLDKLGKLDANNTETATIEFSKSELLAKDNVVANDGDVILTDLSGLNRLGGAITFKKATAAPTNIYISGELALQAAPTASVDFTILKNQTLTVSKNLNLTAAGITVKEGATLINKAAITTSGSITIAAASTTPVVAAGLYISEAGADASGATFANSGSIEWKGGKLTTTMAGNVYANITEAQDLKSASTAFGDTKTSGDNIIYINSALEIPTQLSNTELPNIKKMVINGDVSFGLTRADAFSFEDLASIVVKSGSFSLTGGKTGNTVSDFYTFGTATNCNLELQSSTKLNLAAGTALDFGTGAITYKGATITNNGYIKAGSALNGGTGTWIGNAIGTNPKL